MPYDIAEFTHRPHRIPDASEESAGVMSPEQVQRLNSLTPWTYTDVKNALYDATYFEMIPCDLSENSFTVGLPLAAEKNGKQVGVVVVADGNTLTIDAQDGETVNGQSKITISTKDQSLTFMSDGVSNWQVVWSFGGSF